MLSYNLVRVLQNRASSISSTIRQNRVSRKNSSGFAHQTPYRPDKPRLREANLDDYQQINAIQTRNGLESRNRENWLAFWRDNPVYKDLGGRWPIGWILEDADTKTVGWLGNLPSAYHFRGSKLLCATVSPWVVDESYRAYSTLLLDRFTRQKEPDLRIISTAGPTAGPISHLFGYSKAPVGAWDQAAFWITHYRGFVKAVLSTKIAPLAGIVAQPLAVTLFLRDWLNIRRMKSSAAAEIELCATIDSRFDGFWEELKDQRQDTLLADRDRENLLWHLRDKLAEGKVWILAVSRGNRLVAYTILEKETHQSGLKHARLVDFQALQGCEDTLPSFIWQAMTKCRSEGIHLLEVIGCWLNRAGLPRIAPAYYRGLNSWTFYYKAANRELARSLRDPLVWAPSGFDGDACV